MAEPKGDSLALIFGGGGGGGDTAPEGGPPGDAMEDELGEDMEADAMPPDFAVHASEAFPELAGDDGRLDALYRAIKSCHPVS